MCIVKLFFFTVSLIATVYCIYSISNGVQTSKVSEYCYANVLNQLWYRNTDRNMVVSELN